MNELWDGWDYAFSSSLFPKYWAHIKLLNIWGTECTSKKNVQKVDRANKMYYELESQQLHIT